MKDKNVPEVRFNGYTNAWEQCELGEMYDIVSGYAFKMGDYVESGVPIVNGESIQHGSVSTKNLNFLPQEFEDRYKSFTLNTGDIILGLNRPITNGNLKIAQVPKDLHGALLYQRAGKIIIKNSDINFSYQLLGKEVANFVLKESVGSDQPFISTTKLKRWLISKPSLEDEQSKIGNFFKQLDETITFHQQELTTLKQTKQGFLQKMFPKEGESVPEVRFPGFSGEWEQCVIRDIANVRRGLTYKPTDVSTEGVRVLRSSNINEDKFEIRNDDVFVKKSAVRIDTVKDNDILITSANGSSRLVGKHALIQGGKGEMIHGGFMLLATSSQPYFVNALMSTSWYDKFINLYVSGGNGAIGNISKSDLERQVVYIPLVEEQVQIGNFFKQLDRTIALQEKEIQALQQTKKAFLQKMFV